MRCSQLSRSPTKLSHPTCCSFRFSPSMLHYQTNSSHTTVVCCPNLHRAHDIQPNFLDPLHLMIYTALFKPLDVGPDDRDIIRHEHHHHFSLILWHFIPPAIISLFSVSRYNLPWPLAFFCTSPSAFLMLCIATRRTITMNGLFLFILVVRLFSLGLTDWSRWLCMYTPLPHRYARDNFGFLFIQHSSVICFRVSHICINYHTYARTVRTYKGLVEIFVMLSVFDLFLFLYYYTLLLLCP